MRPKYKTTGCARFFLFLILFVPAVFFGAAYFRGENGVQILKDFYHSIVGGSSSSSSESNGSGDIYDVKDLQKQLKESREEIRKLRKEIEEKEQEIEKLKGGDQ
jgi:cell division protein FtsB